MIEKRVAELESELAGARSASTSAGQAVAQKESECAMASEAVGALKKELESACRKNSLLEQRLTEIGVEMEKLSGASEEALRSSKRAERAESVNRVLESELQSANTRNEDAVRNLNRARYARFSNTALIHAEQKGKGSDKCEFVLCTLGLRHRRCSRKLHRRTRSLFGWSRR
jgi:chromosome segregation ATPase